MHGAVHLQVSGLREAAAADFAAEGAAPRMDEAVATQIGRHAESLPAGVATKGLLSGVDTTVDRQAALAGETVPTLLAGVRPLPRVRPQVSSEAALLAKCLPADAAGEWLQSSVNGQLVDVDTPARGESFLTGRTFKRFVFQVDSPVSRQITVLRELFPALVTPELPLNPLTGQSVPP